MSWTQTTLTIKDADGTSRQVIAYTDGTNFSFAHPILDNTGAIVAPATSGLQTAGNTSAASTATSTADLDANLGAKADTPASTDVGTFSLIALFKRALQALTTLLGYQSPVLGVTAMTVGIPVTAGRAFAVNCTAAGNVAMTLSDTSTYTAPVTAGLTVFPFGVTQVNSSGTTATATYANWK